MTRNRHLVAAPDKFRGTASSSQVCAAVLRAAEAAGWSASAYPAADGGEGTLEALGGEPRHSEVVGPLGDPVVAEWRMFTSGPIAALTLGNPPTLGNPQALEPRPNGPVAVIEMARCSGLALAGGAERNDPVTASTAGVGQLIAQAVAAGATQVVVTCGGSASTDGGWGALEALGLPPRLEGVDLVAAYDVEARFVEAATLFAPQKGATVEQVGTLERRLRLLADRYERRHGTDVRSLTGGGAAGGLAGGLSVLGARLVPGFGLVAEATGLARALVGADLVVTGEGYLDRQSLGGKVVGGVLDLAARAGVPVLVVVGDADPAVVTEVRRDHPGTSVLSLTALVGRDRSMSSPLAAIESVVTRHLAAMAS